MSYIAQMSFFKTALNYTCRRLAVWSDELAANNGRANSLGRVDDFFDSRNTKRDVHRGNPGKMEGFKGHLCPWFSNGLSTNCTHSGT